MVQKILIGVAVDVVAFIAFVATRPPTYHVERSIEVAAPAEVVFAQLDDFREWAKWSPWEKIDPGKQKTHEGIPRTVGASYAWKGNDRAGSGKMTIQERVPNERLAIELQFLAPFKSQAETYFAVAPASADKVRVTWSMDGHSGFVGKLFGLFMDMDSMIGPDYDKGLVALKSVSEAEAAKQKVEAEAAAAKAQADAAAAAEAAAKAQAAAPAAQPSMR